MKMIIAVIQPFMLNKVTAGLEEIEGFPGMSISDGRGFGRRLDRHGNRFTALDPYKVKLRIEIVARNEMAATIVETIRTHARTGNHGDGKIFVIPVEDVVRIQTGETGSEAI